MISRVLWPAVLAILAVLATKPFEVGKVGVCTNGFSMPFSTSLRWLPFDLFCISVLPFAKDQVSNLCQRLVSSDSLTLSMW